MSSETNRSSMEIDDQQPGDRVVVPVLDACSSVACLRSLGRRGVHTIGISELKDPPGFASKYCDEQVSVPDPDENLMAYADALRALAARNDVRTIIPVREADVYCLGKHKSALRDLVCTPWPDIDTLRRVQDRVELFEAAEAAHVPTPETGFLTEWTDSDRDSDVVVKPRYTVHAPEYDDSFDRARTHHNSTHYIEAGTEPDRTALVDELGHVPLVQEYIPDTNEYAFFALYNSGEPVATFQFRQRRGYKYAGGPSAYRESVSIPELDAAGRRLLDHLDWHGLAMVEFLRNPATGEFELMEVNPRFWTSLPFSIRAGVDFPYYYWMLTTGRVHDPEPEYDVGIAGHLLRGELLHLHSILFEEYPLVEKPSFARTLAEVTVSIVRHPRFDYLTIDDPRPFLVDMRNLVDTTRDRIR